MKNILLAGLVICIAVLSGCQGKGTDSGSDNSGSDNSGSDNSGSDNSGTSTSDTNAVTKVSNQVVEASCGVCQFDMEGSGCDLAVRIGGKSYYVDGSTMAEHGDAHGDGGMCNGVRKAKVTGEVKDGRFVSTSFELLPEEKSASKGAGKDGHDHAGHDHGDDDKKDDDDNHKDHDH